VRLAGERPEQWARTDALPRLFDELIAIFPWGAPTPPALPPPAPLPPPPLAAPAPPGDTRDSGETPCAADTAPASREDSPAAVRRLPLPSTALPVARPVPPSLGPASWLVDGPGGASRSYSEAELHAVRHRHVTVVQPSCNRHATAVQPPCDRLLLTCLRTLLFPFHRCGTAPSTSSSRWPTRRPASPHQVIALLISRSPR